MIRILRSVAKLNRIYKNRYQKYEYNSLVDRQMQNIVMSVINEKKMERHENKN